MLNCQWPWLLTHVCVDNNIIIICSIKEKDNCLIILHGKDYKLSVVTTSVMIGSCN